MQEQLIFDICKHFGVMPKDIAKKRYGKLRNYTYEELISRILESDRALELTFPEMSKSTILTTLKKCFPGKDVANEHWGTFLLRSIGYRKCCNCLVPKSVVEFHANKKEYLGVARECKQCASEHRRAYYQENRDEAKEYNRNYYLENTSSFRARDAARRAKQVLATASWANINEIKQIYKHCPDGMHVDHIVPLTSDIVCGLHVEHNLQYLAAQENLSKGNKFDPISYVHTIEYVQPYTI